MSSTRATRDSTAAGHVLRVLRESVLVILVGAALALLANQVSPFGLALTQNYFPAAAKTEPASPARDAATAPKPAAAAREDPSSPPRPGGITPQMIALDEAVQLFRGPDYARELVVFVDARNAKQYAAGHIPGAYHFDRYRPEEHLPAVLPACLTAQRVVVYCTGGQCEDSHFAARQLEESGVPAERLAVFAGGIAEWTSNKLPLETGVRHSGMMQPAVP